MARRINKPQQEITEAAVVKATVAESPAIIAQTNHNQELQSSAIPAQTGQEQQARQEIVSPVIVPRTINGSPSMAAWKPQAYSECATWNPKTVSSNKCMLTSVLRM